MYYRSVRALLAAIVVGLWPIGPLLDSASGSVVAVHAQQPTPSPWLPDGVVNPAPRPSQRDPDGYRPAASTRVQPAEATTAETLEYLNVLRTMNGLPAVAENTAWSAGAVLHSRYVVRTGTLVHDEDDANPHRTPEGDEAGNNGNVDGAVTFFQEDYDERDSIDGWLTAPFHGQNMVDPGWRTTGFGAYRKQPGDPNPSGPGTRAFTASATLDVLRGRDNFFSQPLTSPVMFPAHGSVYPYHEYPGGELPDPLQTADCQGKGYVAPTGAPIYLLLGGAALSGVVFNEAQSMITRDGQPLAYCYITQSHVMSVGLRNGIIFLPNQPLTPGTYTVSVQARLTGAPAYSTYTWSFRVAGPDLTITSSHNGSFQTGTNGVYTLTVRNAADAGPTTRDIRIIDALPTGMTFVNGTGTGWICTNNVQVMGCVRKTPLAPGASSTLTMTVAVGNIPPQTVNNEVSVSVVQSRLTIGESVLNNNASTDPTTIIGPPQPGALQLSTADATVAEDGGSVTLTVQRVNGSDGAVSVNFATQDGTAAAGSDYTSTSGTLTFAAGSTSQAITVPILRDTVAESSETFTVALAGPTGGAVLGAPTTATVTITNAAPTRCLPRPTVRVQSVAGGGQLQVTVQPSPLGTGEANSLAELNFGTLQNATVVLNGQPIASGQVVPLPAGTDSVVLTVQRTTPGQATTVPFTVTDSCGAWPTFVGGGPHAW